MTLRQSMNHREGTRPTEDAIRRGLRAFAVERRDWRSETAIVFGRNRSDALRRAQAPSRLGESFHETQWRVAEITSGWDAPIEWPLERQEVAA